ncbi:CBM_collapsed_G0041410.mRNA.1.CDS.1 [Saccharomyces cerevisiae]|nr:CBM_collapsed_G0041410.mRNA.1.CDS.1 [Saccharomyces cerevisiae]
MRCCAKSYASQNPQNLSAALKLISELENSEEKDSCVTYCVFCKTSTWFINLPYLCMMSV